MSIFDATRAGQLLKAWAIAGGEDCVLCGTSSDAGLVCSACLVRMPSCETTGVDSMDVHAAFAYRFPVDRLIHRFKFAGDLAVGHWLALRLSERVAAIERPDVLVAPPLTPARLRERGFNQALEVAKVVGRAHGVRVMLDALVKTRETLPQPSLAARDRRSNLLGAFACRADMQGLAVAIVDDVVTTGGTVQAMADILRDAGAARVCAWCVARTPAPGL
jgi:ComF family protein